MLTVTVDESRGVALLEPNGPLSENDFKGAVAIIDPFIEGGHQLNGLVIHTEFFPGWDSFAALLSHLSFIKDHHKLISRVAFATDSKLGNLAESVASHFVEAEIKVFSYKEFEKAKEWAKGRG